MISLKCFNLILNKSYFSGRHLERKKLILVKEPFSLMFHGSRHFKCPSKATSKWSFSCWYFAIYEHKNYTLSPLPSAFFFSLALDNNKINWMQKNLNVNIKYINDQQILCFRTIINKTLLYESPYKCNKKLCHLSLKDMSKVSFQLKN